MNRAIIVHCWDGYPDYCWYPWLKKSLEKYDFKVTIPAFPETNLPKLSAWLPLLTKTAGLPDQNLFLIGHSVGCITILRYLEKLNAQTTIGGVVLVAGFTDNLGYQELDNFFTTPINFATIKSKSKKFIDIASDDDPFVPLKHSKVLAHELGAEIIIKHQAGHFSGEDNCRQLPDVLKEVLKLVK